MKGWSYSGLIINCECVRLNYINAAQRIILRIISALCVLTIMKNHSNDFLSLFPYNIDILSYVFYPFLGYRSFKRCVSSTTTFSLHLSFLLCLILINSNMVAQGTLIVLIMPPFPYWFWTAFTSIFNIPPKLRRPKECLYQILYFFLSLLGIVLYFATLGLF